MKSSRFKLVCNRRSTVLILFIQLGLPGMDEKVGLPAYWEGRFIEQKLPLAAASGVIEFVIVIAMNLVTLCFDA